LPHSLGRQPWKIIQQIKDYLPTELGQVQRVNVEALIRMYESRELGPRQHGDPPVYLVDGKRVDKDPWQDESVPKYARKCFRKDDDFIPFLLNQVLIMAALAISNAVGGKFYIPQSDPKFAGDPFEVPVKRDIDADAATALQVLARAVLEYLAEPLEEAVEGTVPSIGTTHTTPAGLEPGEIPSAPRRNHRATLPAKHPPLQVPTIPWSAPQIIQPISWTRPGAAAPVLGTPHPQLQAIKWQSRLMTTPAGKGSAPHPPIHSSILPIPTPLCPKERFHAYSS
jgi:hypothetical protein